MGAKQQLEVPRKFKRGVKRGEDESNRSALWLIHHMCKHVGVDDLGATEVLDVGCGVRFTQALLNNSLPIKRYVGVDVYREMIDFLKDQVPDPRFEYIHVNAHNERYNPDGEQLTEDTRLPVGSQHFDLICLFSVFTHLAPHDYRIMLKLLRRQARPDARLFYTLYINELTNGGHGFIDSLARRNDGAQSQLPERIAGRLDLSGTRRAPAFVDFSPSRPLLGAVYSEPYARELIEGTGWEVLSVLPPDVYIQHHIVCRPC